MLVFPYSELGVDGWSQVNVVNVVTRTVFILLEPDNEVIKQNGDKFNVTEWVILR